MSGISILASCYQFRQFNKILYRYILKLHMRFACAYYSRTNSKVLPTPLHKHVHPTQGHLMQSESFQKGESGTLAMLLVLISTQIVVSNECLVATVSTLSCFNNLKEMKPSFTSSQQGANIDKRCKLQCAYIQWGGCQTNLISRLSAFWQESGQLRTGD